MVLVLFVDRFGAAQNRRRVGLCWADAERITHESGYRWAATEPHPVFLEPNR
jgi:hypothetical protein